MGIGCVAVPVAGTVRVLSLLGAKLLGLGH